METAGQPVESATNFPAVPSWWHRRGNKNDALSCCHKFREVTYCSGY